jgi:hypothetical protein
MWSPFSLVVREKAGATLAGTVTTESGAAVDDAIAIIATTTAVAAAVWKP